MRFPKSELLLLTAVLATVGLTSHAGAQEAKSEEWEFYLTPYLWMSSIEGDISVAGKSYPMDMSFSDILDQLDLAFMGRFEAWKKPWGFSVDALYMNLEDEIQRPLVKVEPKTESLIADFGVSRWLGEVPLGQGDNPATMSFELIGGARYSYLKTGVDITPGARLRRSSDWLEPFVGGRIRLRASDKWAFVVRGDAGGFGIGSASELTWNVALVIHYQWLSNLSLQLGYRIMGLDVEHGPAELDAEFHGPGLGATVVF
jgi:hypothetical protein